MKNISSRLRKLFLTLCSALGPVMGYPVQGTIQTYWSYWTMKMMRLDHLSYKEKLKALRLFSLKKNRLNMELTSLIGGREY